MKNQVLLLFVALFCLLLVQAENSFADDDSSKTLGSDFSSYEPVASEEDAYNDESFMYFDTKFLVSLGTGMQSWTGGSGKIFKPAYPTLNLKLAHFIDIGWALQYGFSYAKYAGSIDPSLPVSGRSGLVELQQLSLSIDLKRYFRNALHLVSDDNTAQVDSPNPYFLLGADYSWYHLVFRQSEQSFKFAYPLPCAGLGIDFSLKPKRSSIEVETRYYPAGLLFSNFDFSGTLGGTKIGNIFAVNVAVKFLFDSEPKAPVIGAME